MSKIFLTGMTAPQASAAANAKNMSFAGLVNRVLVSAGHDVTWSDPDVKLTEEDLDAYDSVIVGVGPVTGLGANRVYGALNIIDLLWSSDKLTLFIDAPSTTLLASSLKSVDAKPTSLIKEFYAYRKGYKDVVSDIALSSRIASAVYKLANQEWPTTIWPSLPWSSIDRLSISRILPKSSKNFININLDSHFIQLNSFPEEKRDKWTIDTFSNKRIEKLVKTLSNPTSLMKWNKGWTDDQVYEQIAKSTGAIISPVRGDGTWWSYRYVQCLNASTPIYSDWQETGLLGASWSHLAHTIESLPYEEKIALAADQKIAYILNIPDKKTAVSNLEAALGIGK
jgi:hypothetical protein